MRPGEGITGAAAEERAPVAIATQAHLDKLDSTMPQPNKAANANLA